MATPSILIDTQLGINWAALNAKTYQRIYCLFPASIQNYGVPVFNRATDCLLLYLATKRNPQQTTNTKTLKSELADHNWTTLFLFLFPQKRFSEAATGITIKNWEVEIFSIFEGMPNCCFKVGMSHSSIDKSHSLFRSSWLYICGAGGAQNWGHIPHYWRRVLLHTSVLSKYFITTPEEIFQSLPPNTPDARNKHMRNSE